MKRNAFHILLVLAGLAAMLAGLFWARAVPDAVPAYLCLGLGAGALGHGAGALLQRAALKDAPDIQRRIEIEAADERNIALANRAKAKAYDAMIYIFSAVMLVFALMRVDWAAVLLLVAAYLAVVGVGIYYRCKYDKEMGTCAGGCRQGGAVPAGRAPPFVLHSGRMRRKERKLYFLPNNSGL